MNNSEIIKELKHLSEILAVDGINAKKKVREELEKLIRKLEKEKVVAGFSLRK